MKPIKLSILIPTYNYKIGINKILNCLESSDYNIRQHIEIIISDDSKNKIVDLNNDFINSYASFKYIHNKKSYGAVRNWNKLISIAKGKYFWLLHHDEFWDKNRDLIKYILEIIDNKSPNCIILSISKEKEIKFHKLKLRIRQRHFNSVKILRKYITNPKLLVHLNNIGPPSTLIYKNNSNRYDTDLKFLVDIDFYIKILKKSNYQQIFIGSKKFNLISSQNNCNSITKSLKRRLIQIKQQEKRFIISKYRFRFKLSEKLLLVFSYLILKVNSLVSTKISIIQDNK